MTLLSKVVLRVVHIEQKPWKNKAIDIRDLEAFFKEHSPSLQITFHNVAGKNITKELEEFAETYDVDLMAMFKPKRGFFEQIFHRSLTKKEVLNSKVPLLIMKKSMS